MKLSADNWIVKWAYWDDADIQIIPKNFRYSIPEKTHILRFLCRIFIGQPLLLLFTIFACIAYMIFKILESFTITFEKETKS